MVAKFVRLVNKKINREDRKEKTAFEFNYFLGGSLRTLRFLHLSVN